MNGKTKDYVGYALIFALAVFALSAASYVKTYSKSIQPSTFRNFSVSGEGKIIAIPDIAQFSFTVLTEGGTDLTGLQAENSKKVNAAIDFIKSEDIAAADIKTENYSISPRYQYFRCDYPVPLPLGIEGGATLRPDYYPKPCPPAEIVGYTISQSVSVKVREFEKIGSLLTGVVESGANSVSGVNFTIDNPTAIENQARAEAIKEARIKAEAIADAGGFRLGKILSITEGGGFYPYYRLEASIDNNGKGGGMPAPAIEPGSQDVVINVSISYEIK
ncbi:MAG: SIMPL domain-containing protein [Patescibacteria group bacterium]